MPLEIIKGKDHADKESRRKMWMNDRIIPALRAHSNMQSQYLYLLHGWQCYIDTKGKDPHLAQTRLPRIYSAVEQATADAIRAFFARRPWFPITVAPHVTDPERKLQARGISLALQDFFDDVYSFISLVNFIKQVNLYGGAALEVFYDYWSEPVTREKRQSFGSVQYNSPRETDHEVRHGIKLITHPLWRVLVPDLGGTLQEKEWFGVYKYIGAQAVKDMIDDYDLKIDPQEVLGQLSTGLPVFRDSDTLNELSGFLDLWGGKGRQVGVLFQCYENGRDPYCVEYLNGEHEIRSYKRDGRRWPIEWGQFTVEPRDNPFFSQGMIDPVIPGLELADDMTSNQMDVLLAGFDPPVFYDKRIGDELRAVNLTRRARIGADTSTLKPGEHLRDMFHVERPSSPPSIDSALDRLDTGLDQALGPKIGRGEAGPASQTATMTNALMGVDQKTRETRIAMNEACLERMAENAAELIDLKIPFHELERRIGPELADIVDRLGAGPDRMPGKLRMMAASRIGANLLDREELKEVWTTFSTLLEQGQPIEFLRQYLSLIQSISAEDIDKFLPQPEEEPVAGEIEAGPEQGAPEGGVGGVVGAFNLNPSQAGAQKKAMMATGAAT